jgi:hypothetical protein
MTSAKPEFVEYGPYVYQEFQNMTNTVYTSAKKPNTNDEYVSLI